MNMSIQECKETITRLEAEVQHWKANHEHMVRRNALLSERTDLLVDRIPAHKEMVRLQEFKQYVHDRLDGVGCPADPAPENTAGHGCRIEGRLDWILRSITDPKGWAKDNGLTRIPTQGELEVAIRKGFHDSWDDVQSIGWTAARAVLRFLNEGT